MVWKGNMFVLDYFGTSMEAIMDDAPSNSITFPYILLIQENIVKHTPQSLQNGSDVFCFSYTAKCNNCRSKNVVGKTFKKRLGNEPA